jgi:hypothetical protein
MVMKLRLAQSDWGAKGAHCTKFPVKEDYDPWFEEEDEAYQICNGLSGGTVCPVRHDCLIFSLINNEAHGVWGGMFTDDRARLRRFTPREDWQWHEASPRGN